MERHGLATWAAGLSRGAGSDGSWGSRWESVTRDSSGHCQPAARQVLYLELKALARESPVPCCSFVHKECLLQRVPSQEVMERRQQRH